MLVTKSAIFLFLWVICTTEASYDQLPVLRSGQICTPGKAYRVECNTCRCGNNNLLLCTKMACLNRGALAALMQKRLLKRFDRYKHADIPVYSKRNKRQGEETAVSDEDNNTGKREGKKDETKEQKLLYPQLPAQECKPGKIYQIGCNRCFCNALRKAACLEAECGDAVNLRAARTPKDVRPPFTKDEVDVFPFLSHSSAKCEPGKAYRVDCNTCLCLDDGNTLCGDLLCISHEDMNSILAKERSGVHCDQTTKLEQKGCVHCACVDGVLQCSTISDCAAGVLRSIHGEVPDSLAPNSVSCVPGSVYKDDCNRCYCQPDKSMRCTRKKCLNYVQVKKLKKLRLELEQKALK